MAELRFGVVFTGHYGGREWRELAKRVEGSGFSTLLVADHYMNPMACGPLMMAAAAATTTLRIGSYVYNNDFRPPALLAKEVATIDVLSDGRMELGIGAGWAKPEYLAAGIQFDPPAERATRFEEGVGVIRRLLAGEAVDHRGEHYRVRGLLGQPLPVQRPIPVLIGCGGPRMTKFAARVADIVGFVPQSLPDGGLDPAAYRAGVFQRRIDALERALEQAGRTTDPPERSVLVFGLAETSSQLRSEIADLNDEELHESPYALMGSVRAMADTVLERKAQWGISYVVCFAPELEAMAKVIAALS